MQTKTKARAARTAAKLAALADPANNGTEAERAAALQKLIELCERHGFNVSDFIKPAASPDAGEQQPEPETATEQPQAKRERAKRAKPDPKPDPATERERNRERAKANAAFTARHYAGPSQASHRSGPPKLSEAIERVRNPIQRAKSATPRDESGLMLAAKLANGNGDFDPCAGTFDLGALSRLASLNLLSVSPVAGRIRITKAGRELAANLARKAAA